MRLFFVSLTFLSIKKRDWNENYGEIHLNLHQSLFLFNSCTKSYEMTEHTFRFLDLYIKYGELVKLLVFRP